MKKIFLLLPFIVLLTVAQGFSQDSNITFKVDMNEYAGSYTMVNVNGTFNGWCGECNPMTDADMDGVYEVTLPLPAGAIEYKFTVDGWTNQENFTGGESCTVSNGGFTNRAYTIAGDADLDVVCWNACDACGVAPTVYDVTFSVDMNEYEGSYTTVNLNGTFNGWCGECNPMTDADMDGVYEVTLPLSEGDIQYKFTVDGWTDQENFAGGETCTFSDGGFTNRIYTIDADAAIETVCWNSCAACSVVIPEYDVTFAVDMNGYTGSYTTVNLNGTFNGWCGGCNPMTDADMDGVYEVTLPLPAGAIEYKFTVDGWTDQENFAGGESCTVTDGEFTNRTYTVVDTDMIAAVCWNSCEACASPCTAPTNIHQTPSYPAKCHVVWDPVPGATKYDIFYRVNGTSVWSRTAALNPYKTLRYLDPTAVYQYRVRANCGDGWSFMNASKFHYFNMNNAQQPRMNMTDAQTEITSISPNPARDILNVAFSTESQSDVTLSVVDMMGKVIYANTINNVEGPQNEIIDVSTFGEGYYMLVMQSGDKRVVKKFATIR